MSNGKKTFVRITNKDIFNKIEAMHTDIIKQNGKIKLNKWIAGTGIGLCFLIIGSLLKGWL